ncbi:MAG: oxidative damage protection protein [Thermomicrobiales bacterium]
MARMIECVKLGRTLPGLEKPPFPGELGQRIFENVSAEGYALWMPPMTILINHYALNPADPETRLILRREMEDFFFGENALVVEDLSPTAATKGGAAPSKGGAAPQRK